MENDVMVIKTVIKILKLIRKHPLHQTNSYLKLAEYYNLDIDVIYGLLPILQIRTPNQDIINADWLWQLK